MNSKLNRTLAKARAAERLRAGGTVEEAAQAAGVHITTIFRWKKDDDEFQKLLEPSSDEAAIALEALVPRALEMVKQVLSGSAKYTPSQTKLAMDVIKAAASLSRSQSTKKQGKSSFEERLAELEEIESD